MKPSLLVIRCQDIETSKAFYEALGLTFSKEKHGGGAEHYSSEIEGFVFEIYPSSSTKAQDNTRLGFEVPDLQVRLPNLEISETYEFEGKKVYILIDPDGRKIELS